MLLDELRSTRDRYALIVGDARSSDALVDRMAANLDLATVRLGSALAGLDHPPTRREVDEACGDATVLADVDVLLWPDLGLPVLPFLAGRARRLPTIAVWPGRVRDHRALYSTPGRPDHHDERLGDVVVLRPRTTRFPDEVPFDIERILP